MINFDKYKDLSGWEYEIAGVIGIKALYYLESQLGSGYLYVPAKDTLPEIVKHVGLEAAQELRDFFGGSDVYIPTVLYKRIRNDLIMEGQNAGTTVQALADKFRLSQKRIRKIINERNRNDRQTDATGRS